MNKVQQRVEEKNNKGRMSINLINFVRQINGYLPKGKKECLIDFLEQIKRICLSCETEEDCLEAIAEFRSVFSFREEEL